MRRDEMIDALLQSFVQAGAPPSPASRRLLRMSTQALQRELLMRGLMEYEEPSFEEDEADRDEVPAAYSLLGRTSGPVYID